jgi:hypothetical protein
MKGLLQANLKVLVKIHIIVVRLRGPRRPGHRLLVNLQGADPTIVVEANLEV